MVRQSVSPCSVITFLLLSLIVALCDRDAAPGEGSADRYSILAGASQGLGYCHVQKLTINLVHDALLGQLNPFSAIGIASGPTLTGANEGMIVLDSYEDDRGQHPGHLRLREEAPGPEKQVKPIVTAAPPTGTIQCPWPPRAACDVPE